MKQKRSFIAISILIIILGIAFILVALFPDSGGNHISIMIYVYSLPVYFFLVALRNALFRKSCYCIPELIAMLFTVILFHFAFYDPTGWFASIREVYALIIPAVPTAMNLVLICIDMKNCKA